MGLAGADEEIAAERVRDSDGFAPVPAQMGLLDLLDVATTDPKDNLFSGNDLRGGPSEEGCEVAKGAGTNEVQRGDLFAKFFVATDEDFGVRKFNISQDFRKKRGFFHVGFDEENLKVGSNNFEGNTGEAGAGAYVGEPTIFHRDGHGGEHAFAEMTI